MARPLARLRKTKSSVLQPVLLLLTLTSTPLEELSIFLSALSGKRPKNCLCDHLSLFPVLGHPYLDPPYLDPPCLARLFQDLGPFLGYPSCLQTLFLAPCPLLDLALKLSPTRCRSSCYLQSFIYFYQNTNAMTVSDLKLNKRTFALAGSTDWIASYASLQSVWARNALTSRER